MSKYTITLEQYEAVIGELIGWCRNCGEERYNVEDDACNYPCESCDSNEVYGKGEYLIRGWVVG